MSTGPKVSVIIPAYNAEPVLRATLECLRKQTWTDFEAIVVDDGSSDGTAEIASAFVSNDPRFSLIRQANTGVAGARNAALKRAQGAWIAFLDADDIWLPEKLSQQVAITTSGTDANFIFCNYFVWDGMRDLETRYASAKKVPGADNVLPKLIQANLFGLSSVLIKKELLDKAGPFDQSVAPGEDWDMWLRVAESGFNPIGIVEPLLRYRVWPGNASGDPVKMARTNVRVLERALQRNKRNEYTELYRKRLNRANGDLELAAAKPFIGKDPDRVAYAVAAAWRCEPTCLKRFFWHAGVNCPKWLGREMWRSMVFRKIARKW